MIKKLLITVFVSALFVSGAFVANAAPKKKITVAVIPFESPNRHSLGEMGRNLSNYMETMFVEMGNFKVVERKKL